MKAIVGLGNPGPKYHGTRHNIGFAVLDELSRRASAEFGSAPVDALVARWKDRDALLVKPLTFMNASGEAIGALLRYFRIDPADLLVVVDDVQLPLARLRSRPRGSAGGHNGLKSIISLLGEEFARLRIGVGRGDTRRDLADHVLARFDKDEAAEVERMTVRAADAAETFIASGIEALLIVAEAALRANDATTWLAKLNEARATRTDLPALADPGTAAARVDLMFRERAFWMFSTGHRLGDPRRPLATAGHQQREALGAAAQRALDRGTGLPGIRLHAVAARRGWQQVPERAPEGRGRA